LTRVAGGIVIGIIVVVCCDAESSLSSELDHSIPPTFQRAWQSPASSSSPLSASNAKPELQ
jgi:hypothetical protein